MSAKHAPPESWGLWPEHDQRTDGSAFRDWLWICTTPRSGSNRLTEYLYELGIGVPGEYMHRHARRALMEMWGIDGGTDHDRNLDTYRDTIIANRTRSGVVGVVLFAHQAKFIDEIGVPARFLHLRRGSISEQLASLMTLYETKMPYEDGRTIDYLPDISEVSPRAIRIVGKWLMMQRRKWDRFLSGKPQLAVESERFFADPIAELRRIVDWLDVAIPEERFERLAGLIGNASAYTHHAQRKNDILARFPDDFAELDRQWASQGDA